MSNVRRHWIAASNWTPLPSRPSEVGEAGKLHSSISAHFYWPASNIALYANRS